MVPVFGSAATPSGAEPTGMVAATWMQPLVLWAVPPTGEDADVVAAAVAIGVSPVTAAVIKIAPRWVNLIMPCLLGCICQARSCGRSPDQRRSRLRLLARAYPKMNSSGGVLQRRGR